MKIHQFTSIHEDTPIFIRVKEIAAVTNFEGYTVIWLRGTVEELPIKESVATVVEIMEGASHD